MRIHDSCRDTNSLGFNKSPKDTRVIVAMSGGVDSSVVAALLSDQGYDVVGITMQLYDHGFALAKKGACCAGRDIHDARNIAAKLGFPHYVLDYESLFKESVIDEFADSYLSGATPIPCIRCNEKVKFKELLETAKELGGDCLATGHYIRREMGNLGPELHSAADMRRDQSYFLFSTTREQLDYLRFPLGSVNSKKETRQLARKYGLSISEKPDSQDICFVPNGNYADVIKKLRPESFDPGEIVDLDGNKLGHHEGIVHYTIGQRRGLGIGGLDEPLYVVKLDADRKLVIVGPKNALESRDVNVQQINWLGDEPFVSGQSWNIKVKIRSTRPPLSAVLKSMTNNKAKVKLDLPEQGISPGQACVFYASEGSRVFGGGWIHTNN